MTLVLAMLLDAIMGEPRWLWSRLPHPAVLMGRAVAWCDRAWNTAQNPRLWGVLTLGVLCGGAGLLGWVISQIPGQIADVIVVAILLAQKSLVTHVSAVADALRISTGDGRRAVAMIVSRDTQQMDSTGVARSAIESGAENLSDGVIAPVFWFAIAGLPGLLIYKITNTADSMIGYLTPRHAQFGWAAARFDDVLNFIPARLTAILIWLPHRRGSWSDVRRDAALHKSPNAGWPEAAVAQDLQIALAGARSYNGRLTDFPFVNPDGRKTLTADDIDATTHILWRTWFLTLIGAATIALIFHT